MSEVEGKRTQAALRSLEDLFSIVYRLLEQCPEDKASTSADWFKYLQSETAELGEVLGTDKEADELGDVLTCALMLLMKGNGTAAQLACNKLTRRHPGVFGDPTGQFRDLLPITTIDGAREAWLRAKRFEKDPSNQIWSVMAWPKAAFESIRRTHDQGAMDSEYLRIQAAISLLNERMLESPEGRPNLFLLIVPNMESGHHLVQEIVKKSPGVRFVRSRMMLEWTNGAKTFVFPAHSPDRVRGLRVNGIWRHEESRWDVRTRQQMAENLLFCGYPNETSYEIFS